MVVFWEVLLDFVGPETLNEMLFLLFVPSATDTTGGLLRSHCLTSSPCLPLCRYWESQILILLELLDHKSFQSIYQSNSGKDILNFYLSLYIPVFFQLCV